MIGDNGICRAHTRLFSISCSNVKPKTERHLVYLFFAVASLEFCSRGDGRVAHGFRSSWWQSHPEVKAIWRVRSAKTNMTKVFFATACHSNSNQCFNMRDRPISTNNKRLQNFACIKLQRGGGTWPSAPCLATPQLLRCSEWRLTTGRGRVTAQAGLRSAALRPCSSWAEV